MVDIQCCNKPGAGRDGNGNPPLRLQFRFLPSGSSSAVQPNNYLNLDISSHAELFAAGSRIVNRRNRPQSAVLRNRF